MPPRDLARRLNKLDQQIQPQPKVNTQNPLATCRVYMDNTGELSPDTRHLPPPLATQAMEQWCALKGQAMRELAEWRTALEAQWPPNPLGPI